MLNKQSGFVSILTVLFFTTLISVATLSFARAMVLERQQQLEDELTKSAYNAALTGIEDAKRAMAYCSTLAEPARVSCENELLSSDCPGFNSANTFSAIGITQSDNNRTSVTSEPAATAAQGYSCVIVAKDTPSVDGSLESNAGTGEIYEMRTTEGYERVRIFWGTAGGTVSPVPSTNPQLQGWTSGPGILQISFVKADSTPVTPPALHTWFAVPAPSSGTNTLAIPSTVRQNINCGGTTASSEGYRCYVDIVLPATASRNNYVMLRSLYRSSDFRIIACADTACATRRTFDNVQPTIDSTGYTSGVARRVKANVTAGGQTVPSAIDTAYGLCKNFRVGVDDGGFVDHAFADCRP